jgi:hypothetical protein
MTDNTIINNTIYKIKTKIYKKYKTKYIRLSSNQLRIFESLYNDGGINKKYHDSKKKLKYSEHSGLLDFGKSSLQRVVINAIQNKSDKLDKDILFPENLPDYFDFEYIFHTHPPTPYPGARVVDGILYEFPSIPDLEQFIDHYNEGRTQGSMIFAPEGLYIIKCIDNTKKIIIKREKKVFNYILNKFYEIQEMAIYKYGDHFTLYDFYNKIAKDRKYLDMYNSIIKKINLKISFKNRVKSKYGDWIIDSFYLKVNPIE